MPSSLLLSPFLFPSLPLATCPFTVILILLVTILALFTPTQSFTTPLQPSLIQRSTISHRPLYSSWDNFGYDDDDDLLEVGPDEGFVAADENDDPAVKAAAGMALDAPECDYDGPVIQVPQGKKLLEYTAHALVAVSCTG